MGRIPYTGSVTQMVEDQPLSKGMLATAVAREVCRFLVSPSLSKQGKFGTED